MSSRAQTRSTWSRLRHWTATHARRLDGPRLWWRGLGLAVAAAPATAGGYLGLTLVISLLPLLEIWLTKYVVDLLTAADVAGGMALLAAALVVAAQVIAMALQLYQWTLAAGLQDRAVAEVDRKLMEAAGRLVDLTRIERPAFHDQVRRAQRAAWYIPRVFLFFQHGLGPAIVVTGLVLLLVRLNPLIPLVLAAVMLAHVAGQRRLNRRKYQAFVERSRAAREMDYCARIATALDAAKEVRIFGLGDFFLARFRERSTAAFREADRIRWAELRVTTAYSGLYALGLAAGFWYVAAQAGAGRLTLGDVALYMSALLQAELRVFVLAYWFGFLFEALPYLDGLFSFLDGAQPAIRLVPEGKGRPAPDALQSGFDLRGVSFSYPESLAPALESLTMRVPASRITAVVGANGAGKSTLVKLLTRLYDPTEGSVLLDGLPLSQYDLRALRGQIAVVCQDVARFALTLGENIAIGAPGASADEEQIEAAAQRAEVEPLAQALAQGYDTPLTRRFAGGVDLSGGEWQRVAIARAFVRDAAVLILDEPTAALDAAAEERLFAGLRALMAGKTAVIISHRFSTVRLADQIVLLERGRLVEAGTHAQLMAQRGRYAALFAMQADRYRADT